MIPLQRPLLPKAESIFRYMKEIDRTRWYTNNGPLVKEYEKRIGEHFKCHAVSCSSATLGIASCLMEAFSNPEKYEVTMPSWTFVATANAVILANGIPVFEDVDKDGQGTSAIGVSQFGKPIKYLHVINDAAGAFDVTEIRKGDKTVISTHATKVFSTGEGGIVLSKDKDLLGKIRIILNHGIDQNKEVNQRGLNGKMSEYNAAVGLASLDEWPKTRERWIEARYRYNKILGLLDESPLFASSLFSIRTKSSVTPMIKFLNDKGIQSRQVWGTGVHNLSAYSNYSRSEMTNTEYIADTTLFLPFAIDMADEQMIYIAQCVKDIAL